MSNTSGSNEKLPRYCDVRRLLGLDAGTTCVDTYTMCRYIHTRHTFLRRRKSSLNFDQFLRYVISQFLRYTTHLFPSSTLTARLCCRCHSHGSAVHALLLCRLQQSCTCRLNQLHLVILFDTLCTSLLTVALAYHLRHFHSVPHFYTESDYHDRKSSSRVHISADSLTCCSTILFPCFTPRATTTGTRCLTPLKCPKTIMQGSWMDSGNIYKYALTWRKCPKTIMRGLLDGFSNIRTYTPRKIHQLSRRGHGQLLLQSTLS
jgi:hypothetical protein